MFLLRLLPLFIFVFCVHPAFASSQDLFFYSSQNNELCSKHKSKAIPSFFNKCFDSNGDYKVVSFLNAEQVRARVIDAPENNTSISGFHIERPFLIIDGIHLSTEEKRSLEDFEKEANAYGFPEVLKAFGYTPILVQFPRTVEKSLQANAMALQKMLNYFANNKVYPWPKAIEESFIILGISQGGVIGRYAAYLYDSNKPTHYPKIKMFSSLDSPHQGAVMPRGILAAIDFWARGAKQGSAEDFLDLVSGPGARDLLIYNTKKENSNKANSFTPNLDQNRFLFNEYRKAANYKGFPSILISQGQLKGIPNKQPEKSYYRLNRYAEKATKVWGRAISLSNFALDDNSVFAENRIYEFSDIDKKWALKGNTSWDLVQGSTYPFIETLYNAFEKAYLQAIPNYFEKTVLDLQFYGKWDAHELNSKSTSFIPTTSSLDLLCDGKISTTTKCAHTQTENDISWEAPGNRSTAKAIYAVDKTHPRNKESFSGRHIEPPYKSDGTPKKNVIQGIQTDLWRLMCELAKIDFNKEKRSFDNPYFIGQFNPETSCLNQSQIPEIILNAGRVQYEPFHLARYDYASNSNDLTEDVSFSVPAGWQKVASFDYGNSLPANGLFEVILKMDNPKSNWLKADLILTQVKNGSNQIQLEEKSISPDGLFQTIRWQLPSSSDALQKFRWIRLILNSSGGDVTISKVRFINNAYSITSPPPSIPFSKIYPSDHVFFTPWDANAAHELDYKDNLGNGARFFFEKAYDGVQWSFKNAYDFSPYKKLSVSYWPNTCLHSFLFIDNPKKQRALLTNGTSDGSFVKKTFSLEELINTNLNTSNYLSGNKLVLQTTTSNEECIIQNIKLEP